VTVEAVAEEPEAVAEESEAVAGEPDVVAEERAVVEERAVATVQEEPVAPTPPPIPAPSQSPSATIEVSAEPPEAVSAEQASELITAARRHGIRGNHKEAIALLEEALVLNPDDPRPYLMLYTNYARLGDDRAAAKALKEYVRLAPDAPNVPEYEQIIEKLGG
jgi:tetratricopeptide (TPR) repeat protein